MSSGPVDPARVEEVLAALVGLPLWGTNRAVDMQMFDLGARREVAIERGRRRRQRKHVGDYGLHIQCAWRIAGPAGIVVASRDLYTIAGPEPESSRDVDWDWETPGASRRDERLAAWLEAGPYVVEAVRADALGGFELALAGGHVLAVWPDDSLLDEHWRLLPPSPSIGHFVVTGAGIG